MITKNQKLMLLSNFALKAKLHLGVIKLSEMLHNDHYAFDMLVRATLTGDPELIVVTKIVSYELNLCSHLIKALDSYLQNIKDINNEDKFLRQSKSILLKLAKELYGIKINGASYRLAVERLLLEVGSEDRTFSIDLARKFYPYCGGVNRTFAERKIDEESKQTDERKLLKKRWDSIDQEFFYDKEISTLGLYKEFMRENRYSEKDIFISEKIAKIITVEIRNNQLNQTNAYRDAVNKAQTLFDNDDLKSLTMIVSREYHNFWAGNAHRQWGHL